MLTKAQLIDSVIELNPGAHRAWLSQFSTDSVRDYLDRLRFAASPRGAESAWRRRTPDSELVLDETAARRAA